MRTPARWAASLGALLLVVLTLGLGGTAFADPGNGRGAGGANGGGSSASSNAGNNDNAGGDATTAPSSRATTATSDQSSNSSASSSTKTSAKASTKTPAKASAKTSGKAPAKASGKDSGKASAKASGSRADHSQGNAGTSGEYDKPQPLSSADQNAGGANGKCPGGPYCSTRDGSPSLNGNGGGKAVGKPCAGCVGKADNKNPKGQYPNGSDHNAGYECDRNNGIGKTNPAHTGCTTSTPPPPAETCPDGSPLPPGGVEDCSAPPVKTCPDGSPLPPGGVQDCSTPPTQTCPDGSPLPAGGNAACEEPPGGGEVEVCPEGQEMENGECVVDGGEETVVPPLPDIAGVETLVPGPQQRPAPNAEVLGAQAMTGAPSASAPSAGAPAMLPATGASSGMGLLTGAGFLLLAAGTALVLRRRLA